MHACHCLEVGFAKLANTRLVKVTFSKQSKRPISPAGGGGRWITIEDSSWFMVLGSWFFVNTGEMMPIQMQAP